MPCSDSSAQEVFKSNLYQAATPPFCGRGHLFQDPNKFKTESFMKLSNFSFQWTKILYQNNLKHIAFFFTFFKTWRCNKSSVITPKKISHGSLRKWISIFTKLHLSYEICRDLPVFSQFWGNLAFISRTPRRNFLWCHYRWLITSLGPKKCKKECNIL